MIARKRYGVGVCWLMAVLLNGGCQSSMPGLTKQSGVGEPVSNLPSWERTDKHTGGEPEILPDTHIAAGRLHESRGWFARAAEQYRMAISLAPDNVESHNRLGIVLGRLQSHAAADEAFARAIELAPEQAHLHNNLGYSYMMQRRWPEAEVELRRAVELASDFARARVNLGMVLAQEERFDESLEQFKQAVTMADAYFNVALMYQSKGRLSEAASAFKTALQLNPTMVAAQKRLDKLPPDVVSAALPAVIAEASPAPDELSDDAPVEKSTRPAATQPASDDQGALTTRPADNAPEPSPGASADQSENDTQTPETDDQAEFGVDLGELPDCLNMSIEMTMNAPRGVFQQPLWLVQSPALGLHAPFGPLPWEP